MADLHCFPLRQISSREVPLVLLSKTTVRMALCAFEIRIGRRKELQKLVLTKDKDKVPKKTVRGC